MNLGADWYSNNEIAVALIPRVASSSIRDTVRTLYMQVSPEDALKVDRRIAWVRDPIERLVSAYSFFHYAVTSLPGHVTGTWESFVDYSMEVEDYHWEPQSSLLSLDGELLPIPDTNILSKDFLYNLVKNILKTEDAMQRYEKDKEIDELKKQLNEVKELL